MEIELERNTNTNTKNECKQEEMIQMTKQMTSPASSSSSPAHEFSFNVSLQSSTTPKPSAIDLTPADEIFFHGHLLPLHLLPISPRSSTNSIDDSSLPIKDLIIDQPNRDKINGCICSSCDCDSRNRGHSFNSYEYTTRRIQESKVRTKAKSFSLFGLARRRKEAGDHGDDVSKKKAGFDMVHLLKKYVKIFSKGRTEDIHFRKQPSFSGKLSPRQGCRRGEFSAPASMRTSPTNSGVISAMKGENSPPSNDSTMEELQAAIQAAIAHCKDSNAAAEKLKSQE